MIINTWYDYVYTVNSTFFLHWTQLNFELDCRQYFGCLLIVYIIFQKLHRFLTVCFLFTLSVGHLEYLSIPVRNDKAWFYWATEVYLNLFILLKAISISLPVICSKNKFNILTYVCPSFTSRDLLYKFWYIWGQIEYCPTRSLLQ